jgi:hypothetical protein
MKRFLGFLLCMLFASGAFAQSEGFNVFVASLGSPTLPLTGVTFPCVQSATSKVCTLGAFTTATITSNAQASNTSTDGLVLADNTAASAANQQYSPRLHFTGQGWETNTTASQSIDWIIELQPVQGAAAPTANLAFSYSINGGAYTAGPSFGTNGSINAGSGGTGIVTGSFSVNGAAPANGMYKSGTNGVGISANSLLAGFYGATAATTTVSASTCATIGTITGNATAGSFALTTGGTACVYTVTLNGATGITAHTGWIANADDVTDQIHCINSATVSTTTVVFTCPGANSSAAVIKWSAVPY